MLTVPSCSWHLEGEKQFSKQMTNAILKRKGCNRCGGKAHLLLSVMVGSFCKHLCWVVDDRAEPALQRFVGKLFQEEASSSTNALTHLWNHYKEPVWIASTYKTAVVCLSGDMTWTNTPFTKVSEDEEKEFDEKVFPDTTLSEAHRRCLSAGVLKASVAHFSLCCMWMLPPLWFFIMDHYSVPKQLLLWPPERFETYWCAGTLITQLREKIWAKLTFKLAGQSNKSTITGLPPELSSRRQHRLL